MVLGFGEVLSRLIQTWTQLESSIGAVSRVKRFTEETEREGTEVERAALPTGKEWPQTGDISFHNLSASYRYVTTIPWSFIFPVFVFFALFLFVYPALYSSSRSLDELRRKT